MTAGVAMSLELPGWVVEAFNLIGLPWPAIDEDELRGWANDLREFATEITQLSQLSHDAVHGLKDTNQSGAVKTLAAHWDHHHSQMMAMRGPIHEFAGALDIAAEAVVIQKGVVIAAAITLAGEVIATQGEALVTFGIAEGELPFEIELTKRAVKFALQELENKIVGYLINQAAKEVSNHVSATVSKMLTGSTSVVFEALTLKADYQSIQRVAATARTHKSRAETAGMRAHRRANTRKIETRSPGGKWHVVRILEAALRSIAEDVFKKLPGALHRVLDETEKDLEKAASKLKATDRKLAGGAPKPLNEETPLLTGGNHDPVAPEGAAASGQPAAPRQLALEAGPLDGPSHSDLMNWKTPSRRRRVEEYPGEPRWRAAERHQANMWGGRHQGNHVPVPTHDNAPYPVTGPGGRNVDVTTPVSPGGYKYHVEVKTYQRWITVNGVRTEQFVPLNDGMWEQISKDVNTRNADPSIELRWVFEDAHPSPALRNALLHAGIIFTTLAR